MNPRRPTKLTSRAKRSQPSDTATKEKSDVVEVQPGQRYRVSRRRAFEATRGHALAKGQRRKNDSVALRGALSRFTQNPWQDCRTGDRPRRVGGSALEQGTLRSPI